MLAKLSLTSTSPEQSAFSALLRRTLVTLVGLALLGSQSLAVLHFWLVPHHLCAEHGMLEEGGAKAKQGLEVKRARAALTTLDHEPDRHAACSVMNRAQHAGETHEVEAVIDASRPACVATLGAGAELKQERSALLAQAPKASPPVRA